MGRMSGANPADGPPGVDSGRPGAGEAGAPAEPHARTAAGTVPAVDEAPIPREEAYGAGLPEGMQPPRKEKSRLRQTVRDMVLTMLVVGGVVVFLYVMVMRPQPDPVRTVDVDAATVTAVQADAFPILVPTGVSPDWRATSARFTPGPDAGTGQWFVGYVTGDNRYAALAQADYDLKRFVKDQTLDGVPDGTQTVGGLEWVRYNSEATGQKSLVRAQGAEATVVTGTLSYDELAAFAETLRPAG